LQYLQKYFIILFMIKNASPILNALRIAANSEKEAVEFMERQRWADAPACPRCGSAAVYQMRGANGERNTDYRWRCRDCAKANAKAMFTVRTGTIFEETRLPMRVWVYAFWRACASKKGISALQLSREMEITHKSALFVLRRIRHGMGDQPDTKLTGTVEVDETYVGGKPRFSLQGKGRAKSRDKAPVIALVQRGGDVRFRMMDRVTAAGLSSAIAQNVTLSSRIITDESPAYKGVGRYFEGGHETVAHGKKEYVREGSDVHSNTVEGVFSLLKRGVMGTFHSVSKKHLPNYLNEFEFRHNTRKMDDGQRIAKAIRFTDGKRLQYRESVDYPPYLVDQTRQADAPLEG
jgi:transposase-like protein